MQHSRPILFQRRLRDWLASLGRAALVVAKAAFLFVTGFRRLKVEAVLVNHAFLLSNGLLALRWKAKHVLWITVQGKWIGGRGNQVMFFAAKEANTVSIRFQGLFSSYQETFIGLAEDRLAMDMPAPVEIAIPVAGDQFCPVISARLSGFKTNSCRSIALNISSVEINLPSFENDNHYDRRLL